MEGRKLINGAMLDDEDDDDDDILSGYGTPMEEGESGGIQYGRCQWDIPVMDLDSPHAIDNFLAEYESMDESDDY